jgi:hypothetical protein
MNDLAARLESEDLPWNMFYFPGTKRYLVTVGDFYSGQAGTMEGAMIEAINAMDDKR